MRFTVFTPSYNRAYIIEKLYNSLKNQVFKDFEWVIVDDGSTDNTQELIKTFIDENIIKINYTKTPNGGKHRAINTGVQKAKGEMFFIVDSDDYLSANALQIIDEIEKSIPIDKKNEFCGVCGLCGYSNEKMIGSSFEGDVLDITALQRAENGIFGDKSEVFYTDIIKKYPFPEFEGEKFLTECIVWDKMAFDGYKMRFFNKIVYIANYLDDGLTKNSNSAFYNSPKGYGLYLYQSAEFGKVKGILKWNKYFDYYQLFKSKLSFSQVSKNLHQNPLCLFLRFFGMKMFYKIYDK